MLTIGVVKMKMEEEGEKFEDAEVRLFGTSGVMRGQ